MDAITSRRAIIRAATTATAYVAGAALVGGGIAIASEVKGAPTLGTPSLLSLIKQRATASDALDRFYEEEYLPAKQGWGAEVARHRALIEAIPHVEERGGTSVGGGPVIFSSAKSYSRSLAEQYVAIGAGDGDPAEGWPSTVRAARRFIEADDRRRSSIAALGSEPPFPARIRQREDEMFHPLVALDERIDAYPVTSLAELVLKIENMEQRGLEPSEAAEQIFADVKRLSAMEGH
ncbi:hypothetical protein NED98_05695 [Sphingomonas sp. MMSM20]|uniref:hypothetical protein n=1 Tax=Sphingomonas lycopersici TaxID=2951807 RepID=UPI0022376C0A|nr:hypothetical protein [Sphingomonas lycopersici]MCW6529733.1 hypothetical protein [Sphingomonas lycopersici]